MSPNNTKDIFTLSEISDQHARVQVRKYNWSNQNFNIFLWNKVTIKGNVREILWQSYILPWGGRVRWRRYFGNSCRIMSQPLLRHSISPYPHFSEKNRYVWTLSYHILMGVDRWWENYDWINIFHSKIIAMATNIDKEREKYVQSKKTLGIRKDKKLSPVST